MGWEWILLHNLQSCWIVVSVYCFCSYTLCLSIPGHLSLFQYYYTCSLLFDIDPIVILTHFIALRYTWVNYHGLRYSFRHPLDVTMSTTLCILGLEVDFGPASLKHSNTFANLQNMSFKLPRPTKMYFVLYFVFEWPVLTYIFAHKGNIACVPAGKITHRDT